MTSQTEKNSSPLLLSVFAFTLFVSASIMFALQPMVGKMLLPIVGGTPSGWVVAMAFFQLMLLAGYFFAHWLSRFTPQRHALLYMAGLAAGVAFLPVDLSRMAQIAGETPGAFGVFVLLLAAVGFPFLVLSATSSTIQRLFTATDHKAAADPYFLYAASNLGSFAGLLLYPLAMEPFMGLGAQSKLWFCAYALLIALATLCLKLAGKKAAAAVTEAVTGPSGVTREQKIQWVLLAFFPSSLLLGVTMHISTDIFSAPMIWVLPLALYLLTFVIAFSRRQFIPRTWMSYAHPAAVVFCLIAVCGTLAEHFVVSWWMVLFNLAVFTVVALACHMRLAQLRPANAPAALTEFYLMLAIGGAAGGLLNAFVIPYIFSRPLEYPLMLILSLLIHPAFREVPTKRMWQLLAVSAGCALLFLLTVLFSEEMLKLTKHWKIIANLLLISALLLPLMNMRTLAIGAGIVFLAWQGIAHKDGIMFARSFHGILRVNETRIVIDGSLYKAHQLMNGTTVHGLQVMNPVFEKMPTTYYWARGPVGDVFNTYEPRDIAVVGLGAGTVNCYARRNNAFTFIDINPDAVKAAQEAFTFLTACKAARPPRIIIGDGRMELDKLYGHRFDLILLDAFSADAIPLHLLTVEALEVYKTRLAEGGMLLFNISNRYFNLIPVLTATAEAAGLTVKVRIDNDVGRAAGYASMSLWLTMSRPGEVDLARLSDLGWMSVNMRRKVTPWTDDYTNLLGTLPFAERLRVWWEDL